MKYDEEYERFLKVYQSNYKIDKIGPWGSLPGY